MSGKSINRRKRVNSDEIIVKKEKLKVNSITDDKNNFFVYLAVLVVVTFGVFATTFNNTYTNWDDGKYVEENPLIKPLNGETVAKMFFSDKLYERYWMGNYHPLSMLTLNLNYVFASKDEEGIPSPFGFQLVNILLHIINTLLVFFILRKLVKNNNIAFFAALLFGVHTLHVESVSWIAERKDVLYTAFFLTSLYFYTLFAEKRKAGLYVASFILFILSLLSKGQATSLALTIILIDYFYERKLLSLKVIAEKIPFFILALIFGLIAIEAQKQGNALQVINTTPILNRIGIAGYGFTMYILKLILPIKLCSVYPYPDIVHQTIPAYFWLGLLTIAGVGFVALKTFKKNKIIFFSIGFFAVNIVLLLQLLPVGSAIYADRYAYIPSIGFYLLVAYFASKIKSKQLYYGLGISYIVILSFLTVTRIGVWKDSRSLWEDVIVKQPKSVVAWNNLGSVYNRVSQEYKDNLDFENYEAYKIKAIECFDKGIARKPDYTSAFYNRGFSKRELGIFKNDTAMVLDAIKDLSSSISTDLTFVLAYIERGNAYDWLNDYERAIIDYNTALQYQPNNFQLFVNRGISKGKTGDFDAAIVDFNIALEKNPDAEEIYANRGLAFAFQKNYELALQDYNKAIELKPDGNTYFNRGMIYYNVGENEKAIVDFQQSINMNFVIGDVYFYKAFCEKRVGQNEIACQDMQIASQKGFSMANSQLSAFCGN